MQHVDNTWNLLPKQSGDFGKSEISSMVVTSESGTLICQIRMEAHSKITMVEHASDTWYIDIDEVSTVFCPKSQKCSLHNSSNEIRYLISLRKSPVT